MVLYLKSPTFAKALLCKLFPLGNSRVPSDTSTLAENVVTLTVNVALGIALGSLP